MDILVVGHFTSKNFFLEDFTYFWILYLIELAEWILLSFFGTLYWIFCLFLSYIWLSKAPIPHTFLGVGIGGRASITIPPPSPAREGNIFQAPISNIKRFPLLSVQFFFLLLLVNLVLHLKALQIVLLTLSCGAGRREIKEVCRRKGIGDFSLCSFYYTLSELRGIKETHSSTSYAKWGVLRSPSERNLPQ